MLSTTGYTFLDFPFQSSIYRTTIPFHRQGMPVPDPQQKHTSVEAEKVVESSYDTPNALALNRFIGTYHQQPNQPKFLGANERIVFESSW